MAKLFFRYGTMGSGKSLDLLKVAYNYEENGMDVLILTSKIDDRYGHDIVKSRTGISKDAIGISKEENIYEIVDYKRTIMENKVNCVLVDEVQFFSKQHIHQLVKIVDILDIPVICYGLRSDFRLEPFEASKYLMAIADEIEELKTICSECGKKRANVNARFDEDGKIVTKGDKIEIGGNDKYRPLCRKCFTELKK
jgi:thymidine kinase